MHTCRYPTAIYMQQGSQVNQVPAVMLLTKASTHQTTPTEPFHKLHTCRPHLQYHANRLHPYAPPTFLQCTSPNNLPHDEGKGIDVNLLEGLKVLEVHTSIQCLGSHVPKCPCLWWGEEERREEKRGVERRGEERRGVERRGEEKRGVERRGEERRGEERRGVERRRSILCDNPCTMSVVYFNRVATFNTFHA